MKNISINKQQVNVQEISKTKISFLSISIGFLAIYLVGLSSPTQLHNAAHDVRHSVSFPCH